MNAHTPGPWRMTVVGGIHDNKLVASAWIEAGEYHSLATLMPVKEVAANARLMAASPDLLEAAKGLLAFIREKFPQDFVDGGQGFTCPHHSALAAAIAKAEGSK